MPRISDMKQAYGRRFYLVFNGAAGGTICFVLIHELPARCVGVGSKYAASRIPQV